MSEMIERVARALCIADGRDPDEDWRNSGGVMLAVALGPGEERRWRRYARQARAAIEETLAPVEGTLRVIAGTEMWNDDYESRTTYAARVLDALADAALSDEKQPA